MKGRTSSDLLIDVLILTAFSTGYLFGILLPGPAAVAAQAGAILVVARHTRRMP